MEEEAMERKGLVVGEGLPRETRTTAVTQESRRHAVWQRIQPLLDHAAVHLGRPRTSRDDLHER
jgi:hypothetical protein